MKAFIQIPDSFIKTMMDIFVEPSNQQIELAFKAFIEHYLLQEELCTGMPNQFEMWLESEDAEDSFD